MSSARRPPLGNPAVLLATWFGTGLLPRAPGTWGSLAAVPFAWAIARLGGWSALALASAAIFALGWWAVRRTLASDQASDPGYVVIDEVAGQWITLIPAPLDPFAYAVGFVLFRVADIFKPWPARWADRHVPGALGVMLDDLLAALYGFMAMLIYRYIAVT